ncbi:hypothetical protein ACM41_03055 [Bradyrhizobium sp. CCBAU 21362]|nr:hypothetical protein [Bradyrhizobium sp. CCBAU 21362]
MRDPAVGVPFQPPIHRSQSEDMPMPGCNRLIERSRSNGALFERQPKSMCCLQTDLEVAVEWQVEGQ